MILELSRRLGAGLLVVGAFGQPTDREFILGLVTRTLLRDSAVPRLLISPNRPGRGGAAGAISRPAF
ncbi:MAG: universal stress protein [Planctomycetaceae bacterium]|nr:universal stress protein [Planctomycetaceae bacterium]